MISGSGTIDSIIFYKFTKEFNVSIDIEIANGTSKYRALAPTNKY